MNDRGQKFSRRDFLLKTALFTASSLVGTNRFLNHSAHAYNSTAPENVLQKKPMIAIIIDDVGYSFSRVLPFLKLNVPITFSILPRLTYSQKSAEVIHSEGHEVMLHQPMEPHNKTIDPGPGALYISQSMTEQHRIIDENISSFPFASGANNHMGSCFTERKDKIEDTLKVFEERGFFFVDSCTSPCSEAFSAARELKMNTAFRDVFIDNRREKQYVCLQLKKLKQHAMQFGSAIGIGHPRTETAAALAEFFKDIEGSSFCPAHVSQLVHS